MTDATNLDPKNQDPEDFSSETKPAVKLERLQKILAQAGISSRRKAEELIVGGRIQINGQVVTELGTKADASKDHIRVDGKLLQGPERLRYFVLNKPKGFVTTVSDPEGRPTVMKFFEKENERLYPVGRLDYLSEGLLLVTNDGELANKLTRAASGVEKTYLVKVSGQPGEAAIEQLRQGIMIERTRIGAGSGRVRTAPADIRRVRAGENPWYEVILIEGRNRELRKMFEEIGHHVEKIRRVGYGPLVLDLEPGNVRELHAEEIEALRLTATGKLKPKRRPVKLPPAVGKVVYHKKGSADAKPASNDFATEGFGGEPKERAPRWQTRGTSQGGTRPPRRGTDRGTDRGSDQNSGYAPTRTARPSGFGDRKRADFSPASGAERSSSRPSSGRPASGVRPSSARPTGKPFGAKPFSKPFAGKPFNESKPFSDRPTRAPFKSRAENTSNEGFVKPTRDYKKRDDSFGDRPARAARPAFKSPDFQANNRSNSRPSSKPAFPVRREREDFDDEPARSPHGLSITPQTDQPLERRSSGRSNSFGNRGSSFPKRSGGFSDRNQDRDKPFSKPFTEKPARPSRPAFKDDYDFDSPRPSGGKLMITGAGGPAFSSKDGKKVPRPTAPTPEPEWLTKPKTYGARPGGFSDRKPSGDRRSSARPAGKSFGSKPGGFKADGSRSSGSRPSGSRPGGRPKK